MNKSSFGVEDSTFPHKPIELQSQAPDGELFMQFDDDEPIKIADVTEKMELTLAVPGKQSNGVTVEDTNIQFTGANGYKKFKLIVKRKP